MDVVVSNIAETVKEDVSQIGKDVKVVVEALPISHDMVETVENVGHVAEETGEVMSGLRMVRSGYNVG